MPKVLNLNIPTNLVEEVSKVISVKDLASYEIWGASIKPSAIRPKQESKPLTELTQLASDAATWLTEKWMPGADDASKGIFWKERYTEIMSNQHEGPYWRELEPSSDTTKLAYPTVYEYTLPIKGEYEDPLRQPTDCRYKYWNDEYNTPDYPTYDDYPSAGWKGTVIDSYFQDLYHAVRCLQFTIPGPQTATAARPFEISGEVTIDAESTIRGNKIWFAIVTKAQVGAMEDIPTHFYPTWGLRSAIPGDSPGGWSHSVVGEIRRYGYWKWRKEIPTAGSFVEVMIATAPSQGRYYARNDLVIVTHTESISVWWPQGPGEL